MALTRKLFLESTPSDRPMLVPASGHPRLDETLELLGAIGYALCGEAEDEAEDIRPGPPDSAAAVLDP